MAGFAIVPEYDRYAVSTDMKVLDRTTNKIQEQHEFIYREEKMTYINSSYGCKLAVPVLYVLAYIGHGEFEITRDKTGYTYVPPSYCVEVSKDEYYLGNEFFKRIPGFSQYFISPSGLIYNAERFKFLHRTYNHNNYIVATLTDDTGYRAPRKVHRLVYITYKGPIPDGIQVDHIDRVRWNNHISNLQLLNYKDNLIKSHSDNSLFIPSASEKIDYDWDLNEVEKICEMISNGISTPVIATELGKVSYRDRTSIYDLIYNIKTGKAYSDIMLKYVDSINDINKKYAIDYSNETNAYKRTSKIYSEPPKAKEHFNYKDKQYKLTPSDVVEIKKRLKDGNSISSIAKDYNVSYSSIQNIQLGKSWNLI